MKRATNNDCPRCGGKVPNDEQPGAYIGALSRVADIEICSKCGTDEAMRDFARLSPIKPEDWPITKHLPITEQIAAINYPGQTEVSNG